MAEEDIHTALDAIRKPPALDLPKDFVKWGFDKLPDVGLISNTYSQSLPPLKIQAEGVATTLQQLERVTALQQDGDSYLDILRQPQGEAIWAKDTANQQAMLGLEGIEGAEAFPSPDNLQILRAKLTQKAGEQTRRFLDDANVTLALASYLSSPLMEELRKIPNPQTIWSAIGAALAPIVHAQYADGLDLRNEIQGIVAAGIEEKGTHAFRQEIDMCRRDVFNAASHQKGVMIEEFPSVEAADTMRRAAAYMSDKPIEMARALMQADTVDELATNPLITEIRKSVADPQAFWAEHKTSLIDKITTAKREDASNRMHPFTHSKLAGGRGIEEIASVFRKQAERKDNPFFTLAMPGSDIPDRAAITAIESMHHDTAALCTLAKAPVSDLYAVATLMGDYPILSQAYIYHGYKNMRVGQDGTVEKRTYDDYGRRNDPTSITEEDAEAFLRFKATAATYSDALASAKDREAPTPEPAPAPAPTTSWQDRVRPQHDKTAPLNDRKSLPGGTSSHNGGRFW